MRTATRVPGKEARDYTRIARFVKCSATAYLLTNTPFPGVDMDSTAATLSGASDKAARRRFPLAAVAMVAALLGLTLWQAALWSERAALQAIREEGLRRLSLYVGNLTGEMERHDYLPRILAEDGAVKAVLLNPRDGLAVDMANRYLERINDFAQASATYVMDRDGMTLAASNWRSERSFVGRNFQFRPYFQQAMGGELGRYFALGTTSLKPGYYLARPVFQDYDTDREIIGVIVVKVGMEQLEETWRGGSVQALVSDAHGVVFIASDPAWRFKSLEPLEPGLRDRIRASRQYHDAPLDPLPLKGNRELGGGDRRVKLERTGYLMQSAPVPETPWTLHVLSPIAEVKHRVFVVTALAGLVFLIVLVSALYLVQRRRHFNDRLAYQQQVAETLADARDQLEARVRERTSDLSSANRHLMREIRERRRAELDLRRTQAELLQAGKLAVLGTLSTSINHELNQPLGAIRSYADNARAFLDRARPEAARDNLVSISELTERMAAIITRLKSFARKSKADVREVPLRPSLTNALDLLEPRLRKEGVEVVLDLPDGDIPVRGGAVRLEQVFVNLFTNAVDAMAGRETRVLAVTVDETEDGVSVRVADTGHGIPEDQLPNIFDAFVTTKGERGDEDGGLGIGLSISYSIVENFGGTLEAANRPKGGAVFTLRLRKPGLIGGRTA